MFGSASWRLERSEKIVTCNLSLLQNPHLLVGITRVRNEALILQDTLDHVGTFADAIIAYDDASTDETPDILKRHPKVAMIIANRTWVGGSKARLDAETRHRGLLLDLARKHLHCKWIYCFDADERIIGELRNFLGNVTKSDCNGVRVRLFDAYLTPDDQAPVEPGQRLVDRRRFFGPEERDILMLWRNTPTVQFRGLDAREPMGVDRVVTKFACQHYGKAISVEQWEATCDYYAEHFPLETYGRKWRDRKGKAIHTQSDFSMQLYEWGHDLFANATPMIEVPQINDRAEATRTADQPSLLLATNYLFGWTGSETLLLTLAEGLRKHGCKLAIYARHLDMAWASSQINPDIRLVDSLDALRTLEFDLAHVQHSSCLVDIRTAFPTLPILFSSLGVLPFLEHPPLFNCGIAHYLAISEEVKANLVAKGIPESKIEIVRNLVSNQRFRPIQPIHRTPERILVLSNKMDEARKLMLLTAARKLGASIRFVGGNPETLPQDQLAMAINAADVVVSLGRGVVEAMLCGRVPLVFDIHGGDGLATPENLEELRTCNFSGRYHRHDYTVDDLVVELGRYRQDFGSRLRVMAEEQFGLEANLPRLLNIYSTIAGTKVTLTTEQKEIIAFCSLLAREDIQQSRHHIGITENLQSEIRRIKHTISWRITSPLRVGWNLLRRLARPLR